MLQDFPIFCQIIHEKFKRIITYLGTSVFRIFGSRFIFIIFPEAYPYHVIPIINIFDIFYSQ